MIDSLNKYASPEDALLAFSLAGLTFEDENGVERIRAADIDGLAICEIGEHFIMTDPGNPADPINFPPTYTGDGFHWVLYRHMREDALPAALLVTSVWNTNASPTTHPTTDPNIPSQFWL